MNSKDFLKEGFIDDATNVHLDHEVQMAREECYHAAEHALAIHKLLRNVSEQQGLEGWVSSKITLANDYLNSVREHLEYDLLNGNQNEVEQLPISLPIAETAEETTDTNEGRSSRGHKIIARKLQDIETKKKGFAPDYNKLSKDSNEQKKKSAEVSASKKEVDESDISGLMTAASMVKDYIITAEIDGVVKKFRIRGMSGPKSAKDRFLRHASAAKIIDVTPEEKKEVAEARNPEKMSTRAIQAEIEQLEKKDYDSSTEEERRRHSALSREYNYRKPYNVPSDMASGYEIDRAVKRGLERSAKAKKSNSLAEWKKIERAKRTANLLDETSAGNVSTVINPKGKDKSKIGSLFGGTYKQKRKSK